ncbi:mannosyl-oligosaccharide 1,2-alpha-mannosidase IC [Nannizzia gypsea CBS 118893]|uniref:alpha-1,2-Mannosidase n=1 Tax=Arthroderma gypseum (strain ATCC MYA-4604 / CBS 118893) TaxID=535722 RepID=E5QZV9_ARTGP|nr:mannosyl-oligosaccharide 1,2-alpha-mannosidase IC [Nannizzia gypsea CBS 118893]EFQ97422.1 mannosyl-oligosaccharide 1,2-alpha-mannosidase IC [Nannizzia gypsea CBS 118893]
MFRFRRYRVYLVFSIISILAIIHFSGFRGLSSTSSYAPTVPVLKPDGPKQPAQQPQQPQLPQAPPSPPQQPQSQPPQPPVKEEDKQKPIPPPAPPVPGNGQQDIGVKPPPPPSVKETPRPAVPPVDRPGYSQPEGKGRQDADDDEEEEEDADKPRWEKQPEHFPIASENVIPLPTGSPKKLPKIQFDFPRESAQAKEAREQKLAQIKNSLKHSWNGYRQHAWLHDEVRPESGGYRDPFMGWGATLVDSLDTLWIAGMKEEFEEAVRAVGKLDFKTSKRRDIPLFETVIRYLGGLIGAYDISDGRYGTLLDKAIELADILMGAFDTPNRMPVTYYMWAPEYASQRHRSGKRVVLAELGSLSVEFTRLAQITENNRYYDAIARITNALEKWQPDTSIPGLWPSFLDASGCKTLPRKKSKPAEQSPDSPVSNPDTAGSSSQQQKPQQDNAGLGKRDENKLLPGEEPANYDGTPSVPKVETAPPSKLKIPDDKPWQQPEIDFEDQCEEQGLSYPPGVLSATYTLAALADSVYEYLPKTYALLGGLNDQYKNMYKLARDATMKHIAFRPMLPDSRDILFIADTTTSVRKGDEQYFNYKYHPSHLGCFVGGMFGVGSRLFGLDQDLEIAKKMADACFWAYNVTATQIMPEAFAVLPCKDMQSCEWNQTAYNHAVYPYEIKKSNQDSLTGMKNGGNEAVKKPTATHKADPEALATPPSPEKQNMGHNQQQQTRSPAAGGNIAKRDDIRETPIPDRIVADPSKPIPGGAAVATSTSMSHAQLVDMHIRDERIPPGMTKVNSAKYILRPEAIESVFIMYRITGDESWREKGWEMFNAIERATRAEYAHSAIRDVTSKEPVFQDEMESFWIGETLKYFYLLFSDPDVVSLDDYVLNTEAHPHKRPSLAF